ncbi:hypothetical protein [Propionivibrio dicarboxylicus]|uniref:Uncharacterized protein n=1 Tax=Propionivibrio dicarboxylicus TaxID=83767 RepID=A0A1G8E140_9RHOO|nr:hypothetical protein [Propionivibrio dicarboxylicus]SDH63577.1 hypothetical protein SAMN05660652_01999 [Propionivibrio dicarboxylicus]
MIPTLLRSIILTAGPFAAMAALAAGPTPQRVTAIEALDKATLYRKSNAYLGFSCRTAPEGDIEWLKKARLGDSVFLGKHSFKAGVIEAITFTEDLRTKDGRVLAAKGDTQCVLAADERALPYDEKRCDGMWVFIPKCRVVER